MSGLWLAGVALLAVSIFARRRYWSLLTAIAGLSLLTAEWVMP